MLRRLTGFLVVLAAVAATLVVGVAPAQADYLYCDPLTSECYTVIESPAVDPVGSPDPETGFTPGASQCLFTKTMPDGTKQNVETPCSTGGGNYWSNNRQCYVNLMDAQNPAPPGGDPLGAWYMCTPHPECGGGLGRDCYGTSFWSDTPPPGITRLSPGQAAAILIRSFQLQGVNIGFAPDPNVPGSVGYVGIPIWMWVNDPTPLTYGPYSQTATLGGVTITATASVRSILWNMGDGGTVACANPGTPYQVSYGLTDSPNCGYRYSTISNGRYNVTATSQWSVDWTGGGQAGTVPLTTTSNTTVEIRELQSVNVD